MAQAKGVLPSKEDDRYVLYKNPNTCGYFIGVRLKQSLAAEQLQDWLGSLDAAVDALVLRAEPDEGEEKGRKVASVAVGVAATFFDRMDAVGIGLERPSGFTPEAAAPTPRFGPAAEQAVDAFFYVASVEEFRVEQFLRAVALLPAVESVSMDRGYQRLDETEPFGYRDGVRNVKSSRRTQVVYVHRDGGQPDEPSWAEGGTYMVTMRIFQNPIAFAALENEAARDVVIGRTKDGTRMDLPPGSDPHEEAADVPDALPPNSHVRKAGPRGHHDDNEIFRRGMPFVDVTDGSVQVGLHFCSFQATPNQFDAAFNDWMMNVEFPQGPEGAGPTGADALMTGSSAVGPFVQSQQAGMFFVPPYRDEGIAATLTPSKPHKPMTGRLAINKVVKDANDPGRRFERAGFVFEVRDASGNIVAGSQFTTSSNGRGVCPAELPMDQDYKLVETFSPHPNVPLVEQDFRLDKPNKLLRIENLFVTPPPPGAYGSIPT